MNFAEREITRIIVNTGKFVKNSGLILTEEITTQNVYYRLSYLISYLLFREKGLLIFKGGLSGVQYHTLLTGTYVQNIYPIEVKYVFLEIVHQGLSCGFFFKFFVFSPLHGPVEN